MPVATFAVVLLVALTAPFSASLARAAAADEPAAKAPIGRFEQLDDDLYRGGQPDDAGFRYLRDMGIRTVVSFRNDTSEKAKVESLGMRFVSIPITFRAFGWGDDFDVDDVRQFMAVVDDPAAGPVFFHCRRGADRTGSMAAVYRIARQGWDEEKALDEARARGMRWWYFPMRGKVKAFAREVQPVGEGAAELSGR